MNFAAAAAIASTALVVYVAALNHRFAHAPGWRDQRWFSAVSLAVAGYTALNVPIAMSASDLVVLVASRGQLLFIALHAAAWLLYSRAQLAARASRWERGLAAALALLGLAALLPGVAYAPPVRRSVYEPLALAYAVPTASLVGELLFGAAILTLALVTARYGLAARRGARHALTHFASLAVFLALEANDMLVALGVYSGPYLIDLAVLLPIGAVGYSLTSRFAEDARSLAELRHGLEALVAERTRELSEAQEALHRAEKLAVLGQFSAGIAHEVNNPAAVVSANLGYLEESLASGGLPDDALECVKESLTAIGRISTIVRQLLDAGRVAANKVPLEPVSVAECAREAAAVARVRFPPHVTLELSVADGIVAVAEDRVLVQILVNLLVNGAQAVPASRRGRVAVRADAVAGGRVRIAVEDDGAGMDDEVLRRVFEPFFSTKPVGVGTGLGLAVSRGLVTSLGGKLDIETALGRGTRVIVHLTAAMAAPRPAEDPAPTPAGPRRRVLLVDDEPVVLRALVRALEPHYDATVASSVDEALALADLRRPDLILCDMIMPDGGGEALYRLLREHDAALAGRIVFMTGGAASEGARTFLAAPPQPVLQKPLDLSALARIAERIPPLAPLAG